ncbi:chromosome partitioning protein ParB [Actinoalloteichus sp. AHMU CJ021]|uniref:ParB/RepB/Spo0J family partition protein n=1 Tax=Actinoalloteichus sp. AHMU CJ021 TaxID=2072503 RepID=UPI000CA05086|nr:chromosome partitioning protein ParB [Actinoalloteichus sp. AHMU CJ021]
MKDRKGGLGRGLAALIPSGPAVVEQTASVAAPAAPRAGAVGTVPAAPPRWSAGEDPGDAEPEVAGAIYREVPIGDIRPNPKQPRQVFDEEALSELEHSIREFGLMQPIVLRELGRGEYELVMGERRWRASQRAGLETIPAIVRRTADDAMLRDALLENIHRVQLNPLEEAAAYQQLLEEFGVTHEELASRLGRSRPVITNTIRLLRLPLPVQRRVAANVLSAGHARALLSLEDPGGQEELASRIVAEGLSVRATEEAATLARRATPPKPKPAAPRPEPSLGLEAVADRLADVFDTRVKVDMGRRKGRIVVEFGSVDDLERIVRMITANGTNGT